MGKKINGSFMVWLGKVWLLRKITEKKTNITQWLLFVTFVPRGGGYSYTPIPIRVCVYVSPLLLYRFWYSWFFLINLMNTGIGQSKYFTLQPFSPCLICLCSSLFDFNSIFIFFDWSRSCVIQSCATGPFTVFAVVFQALVYIVKIYWMKRYS